MCTLRTAFVVVLVLCCCREYSYSQSVRTPDAAARRHIQEIITTLPVDSSLRRSLEELYVTNDIQRRLEETKDSTSSSLLRRSMEGAVLPDGIHKPWMDDMKRAEIKMAMFEVHGVWHSATHFQPQSTKRVIYRKDYDGPGSQITDPNKLAQIRGSGLEAELENAAFQKALKSSWIGIDSPPQEGDSCSVSVYLFDDEWLVDNTLSTNAPKVGRYEAEEFPLGYAAADADVLTVQQQLSTQQFSEERLNVALFAAVGYPSNNTDVISRLLKAGANVNAERQGGLTPLMDAAFTMNLANVKLLLNSGADLARKTPDGQTAYSRALQRVKQFEDNGYHSPSYAPELIGLLKPAHLS